MLAAMFDDCRARTLRDLDAIDADQVDAVASGHVNTIGSILYHIAAIELDWMYVEILAEDFPEGAFGESGWFPHDVREEDGRLSPVVGDSLERHLERLAWVRSLSHGALARITDDDLHAHRQTGGGDTVTPEWVLNHLMQHEAEHRGQLGEIATALRS